MPRQDHPSYVCRIAHLIATGNLSGHLLDRELDAAIRERDTAARVLKDATAAINQAGSTGSPAQDAYNIRHRQRNLVGARQEKNDADRRVEYVRWVLKVRAAAMAKITQQRLAEQAAARQRGEGEDARGAGWARLLACPWPRAKKPGPKPRKGNQQPSHPSR